MIFLFSLFLKPKESRGTTDFDGQGPSGGSSSIRRSHSQSQLNKPSNDLLGLTLHPMDPIDPPTTNITPAETQETSKGKVKSCQVRSGHELFTLTFVKEMKM